MLLQHTILRAPLDRLSRDVFVVRALKYQDRDAAGGQEDFIEGIDALTIRKNQVEQNGIYASLAQSRDRGGEVADPDHFTKIRRVRERHTDLRGGSGIVADDKDVIGVIAHSGLRRYRSRLLGSVRYRTSRKAPLRGSLVAGGNRRIVGADRITCRSRRKRRGKS